MNLDALIWDKPLYGALLILTDLCLKGILILVGARLLTALLSSSAAAARHLIWATALLMILLLPAFSVFLPPVHVPLVKQPFQSISANASTRSGETARTRLDRSESAEFVERTGEFAAPVESSAGEERTSSEQSAGYRQGSICD